MIHSLNNLIHTPLYGEMLLAITVLGLFASMAISTQPESVSFLVRRCTVAAFGVYMAVRIVTDGVATPGTLITYAFRGFVAAGLTYCLSAYVLTAGAVCIQNGVLPVKQWVLSWLSDLRLHREQSQEEERRRESEREEERTQRQRELEREHDERSAAEAKAKNDAEQTKRVKAMEKAWFQARVFYDTLPEEARNSFTLNQLNQYFDEFVHAGLTCEEINERAAKVRGVLTDRANAEGGPFDSFESIVAHFEERREEVLRAGLSLDQADSLLTDLESDKARAIRELREQAP